MQALFGNWPEPKVNEPKVQVDEQGGRLKAIKPCDVTECFLANRGSGGAAV